MKEILIHEVIAKITLDESVVPHFKWQQGILRYKGRIWVGDLPDLHSQLLSVFHDSVLGDTQGCLLLIKGLNNTLLGRV
jgi:hypothetical protein